MQDHTLKLGQPDFRQYNRMGKEGVFRVKATGSLSLLTTHQSFVQLLYHDKDCHSY